MLCASQSGIARFFIWSFKYINLGILTYCYQKITIRTFLKSLFYSFNKRFPWVFKINIGILLLILGRHNKKRQLINDIHTFMNLLKEKHASVKLLKLGFLSKYNIESLLRFGLNFISRTFFCSLSTFICFLNFYSQEFSQSFLSVKVLLLFYWCKTIGCRWKLYCWNFQLWRLLLFYCNGFN